MSDVDLVQQSRSMLVLVSITNDQGQLSLPSLQNK